MSVKSAIASVKTAMAEGVGERASPEAKAAVNAIIRFAAGFILSAARILNTGSPFGIAAVAASGAGLNGLSCLVGSALGYIVTGGIRWGIRYIAAVVLTFTVEFAFSESRIFDKRIFAPITAAVVTLGTGILASFALSRGGTPEAAILFLETVLAFGCCYFFREALSHEEATTETAEMRHISSVVISIAVLLMALSGVEIFGEVSIGRVLAILAVMTATLRCGMMMGCTVGTAFGIAMDLVQGGVPFYTMAYAFAGLLSGVFNRHGRLLFLISFIMANAVAVLCTWTQGPYISALLEVFTASVIFMLLPSGFLSRVGALIQPVISGTGESGLRRYVSKRVSGLSSAYAGLYEIVRRNVEEPVNDDDPAKVFDRAADTVCISCKQKNRCWNSEYMDTLSAMNDAMESIRKRGTLQLEDIPKHFTERCRTPEAFVTAVNAELRASAYRKQFASRLRENRDTAWRQYLDMADILDGVALELASVNGADHLAERRLIRYLRTLDIDADTAVYRDGHGRLRAVIESGNLSPLLKQPDYMEKLSGVLGMRLCRPKMSSDGEGKITLAEAEPLAVSVGIAAMKKKGESVSGDRGTYFKTDAGVLCVILSDGMGTGDSAARDSAQVIEILEKFLRSGVDPATAMKILNSVMLLRSSDSWGYATVDLMCVDLFTGDTCFYKYGAAPSYVKTGRSIRRIKGETLAAGLSLGEGIAPDIVRMRLKPGCTAIIASDGVLSGTDDEWMRQLLQKAGDDMKALARMTVKEAERLYGASDDMTVVTVRVEERA